MKRGPGRPPHPDVLTPSEWRVLEQLRAGRPNAEIAVRLGISVNTVKYHVSNILGKLELADRESAAAWDGAPRRARVLAPVLWLLSRLGLIGGGAVGVAGLGAVIVVVAIIGGGGESDGGASVVVPDEATVVVTERAEVAATAVVAATDVAPASTATPVAEGLPFEQHAEYRGYEAAELEAAGFVDTGAFLRVPFNRWPIGESSYRAGFTGVRASGDGFVSVGGESDAWSGGFPPGGGWSGGNAIGLKATVDGQELYLTFGGGSGVRGLNASARVMWAGESSVAFYEQDAEIDGPILMIAVTDAAGGRYPAIVDDLGHLWVRLVPLLSGPDEPIAYDTGEQLSVEGALGPLPAWPGGIADLTWCEGGTCFAVNHSGVGLRAPIDGWASCTEGDDGVAVDLEAGGYRIRFQSTRVNDARPPTACDEGFPRDVREGETLSGFPTWTVTAFDGSSVQVNVAVGTEWYFWVDVQPPAITECPPCRAGN